MGGHGGLNILPQKKWNVYNRDNRTVVERDQRLDRERREREREEHRNTMSNNRVNYLREEIQEPQSHSLLTQELQKISEQHSHVNLFEREERLIQNKEVMEGKILDQLEFIKDKPLDIASKFLGSYNLEKTKPWYLKTKEQLLSEKNQRRKERVRDEEIQSVKKSTSIVTKEVFKKEMRRDKSRSRSRDRQVKKEEPMSKMEQMREERAKREQKERMRAKELLLRHSGKR